MSTDNNEARGVVYPKTIFGAASQPAAEQARQPPDVPEEIIEIDEDGVVHPAGCTCSLRRSWTIRGPHHSSNCAIYKLEAATEPAVKQHGE